MREKQILGPYKPPLGHLSVNLHPNEMITDRFSP